MKKKAYETVGAIDVGSNNFRLTIAQVNEDGSTVTLEELTRPTEIGTDVFQEGRIRAAAIRETVEALAGFASLLKEYRVKTYKAVATSAFREAENREYVLERIRMETGLTIDVINSAQERYYMYKALRYRSPDIGFAGYDESALVVNIASGGVEFSIYEKGSLMMTEYIKIGALRLHETLSALQTKTFAFSRVMEEFIDSRLLFVKSVVSKAKVRYFIGLGSELNTILGLCSDSKSNICDVTDIAALYEKVTTLQEEKIMELYDLTEKRVETLVPSIILLNSFLKMTQAKNVYIPMLELRHGMICDLADRQFDLPRRNDFFSDIIGSVWYIARKYGVDKQHSELVAKLALSIFDQTRKIHRLTARDREYLQIAAILHSVGYFTDFTEQSALSFWLIQRENIMGLSNKELEIVANIVLYHDAEVPREHHLSYRNLAYHEKIIVSKLAAILKLANSLDISHRRKITQVEILRKNGELLFNARVNQDILLEEWVFAQRSDFFEEITGLRPVLKKIG